MSFQSLSEKIEHARSLSEGKKLKPLPYTNLGELMDERFRSKAPYLTYINDEDRRTNLTYNAFLKTVKKTAAFLQNQGLSKGDRIATISHNHWHTVVHYYAAWMLGLVVVPINLGEDDERIAYILENGEVKLAFVRDQYVDRIQAILADEQYPMSEADVPLVVCGDDTEVFEADAKQLNRPDLGDGELEALIVFTSGTTGKPKAVVLSQRNLLEDARTISEWHGIDQATRMMCVLPIHHVNGTVVTMITPFYVGGSTVLNQRFRTRRFFPIINEEAVHIVSVVPTLLQYLNSYYEDKEAPPLPNFRHVICGAGPLTVQVAETFEERFGKRIIHGYGLSETTCYSCFVPRDISDEEHAQWRSDFGYPSIGVPVPANQMAIHDSDGNELEAGERGEIVIRGVNVMLGYYNNTEANEKAFKNGWFRSGDEGFMEYDDQGRPYFFITGRLKELIIRGGVNLAPLEIDEVINHAPGVKAGIAVGFENDWYGEEVGAYIELEDGAKENEEQLLEYFQEQLPFSKTPKVIVFGDQIPVTSTGKYQRMKVAHLFEEWKSTQFRKEK
ncbi:MAG: class I adenylate-forming enzyme family protein [Bacteroidota bacterium]